MTETTNVETTMIYAGRRMSGTKCLYAYTVEGEGLRERYWAKPLKRGVAIGGVFDVTLDKGDETVIVKRVGDSKPQIAQPNIVAEWSAADKATAVMLAKITNDRKRAREANDPIEDAIDVLRRAYFAQRTIASRAAFAEYVTAAIAGAR